MGASPRQASSEPFASNRLTTSSIPTEPQQETVEESAGELDLIGILRKAAEDGTRSVQSIADAVADAARVLSSADGIALGLETKGRIICRARSGNIAPELGAPINTESGISGECLRTVSMLVCHDALTDPRVDSEVCRMLGIRSVAAVPVRGGMTAAGILEAFSARPEAFDAEALSSLRELAEIAEAAYKRQAPERFIAERHLPERQVPERQALQREVPEFHPPERRVSDSGFVVKPLPAVGRPKTYFPGHLAADEILGESQPGKKRLWIVVGSAAILLLTVTVAWWSWRAPADEVAASGTSVHAASPEPARVGPALDVPKPTPGLVTVHSDRSQHEGVENAAELKPIEERTEKTIVISGNAEARPRPGAGADSSVPDAPAVNLSASANPEALSRLTSIPTTLPLAGPRISEGVVEARLIHRVDPVYPSQARTQRMSGKVTLTATIGPDGLTRKIVVIGGSPVLAAAAKNAVQQWRYTPAKLNGTPVEVQKEITIVFTQP